MTTTPEFVAHAAVADGASDLFASIFDEGHTRVALGAYSLPLGAAIMLCGITVYVALRSSRRAVTWGMPAMRIGLLAIVLVGAVALARSFRAA